MTFPRHYRVIAFENFNAALTNFNVNLRDEFFVPTPEEMETTNVRTSQYSETYRGFGEDSTIAFSRFRAGDNKILPPKHWRK